jgi:hypothetical protein
MLKDKNVLNIWYDVCKGSGNEDFNNFHSWITENQIKAKDDSLQKKYTNKYRNLLLENTYDLLIDHVTCFKDIYNNKHIILQPYYFYPIGHSAFESQVYNCSRNTDEITRNQKARIYLHQLEKNIKSLGFDVVYHKSSKSWYSPNRTIMIEMIKI